MSRKTKHRIDACVVFAFAAGVTWLACVTLFVPLDFAAWIGLATGTGVASRV